MKKTLIAAAVLAASGASFAQVTVTGSLITGYKASSNAAKSVDPAQRAQQATTLALIGGTNGNPDGDASGLGVDTAVINIGATEDLGGGMKLQAQISFDGVTRKEVKGGDAFLKLTTSVGLVTLQTYKLTDYLSGGISSVGGVSMVGMDDKVFATRSFYDSVGFDTKLGPVYLGIAHLEIGSPNTVYANTLPGLGRGASGEASTVGQRLNSLSATYVGGKLIANANYLIYDNRTDNSDTSRKDVIRAAGSYDFGAVKLGAGYSVLTVMSGGTISDALVAVSVPMGALKLGANVAQGKADGIKLLGGALNYSRTGYGLSAEYSLSKRTSLIANYANWVPFDGATQRNNETNLLVSHSF